MVWQSPVNLKRSIYNLHLHIIPVWGKQMLPSNSRWLSLIRMTKSTYHQQCTKSRVVSCPDSCCSWKDTISKSSKNDCIQNKHTDIHNRPHTLLFFYFLFCFLCINRSFMDSCQEDVFRRKTHTWSAITFIFSPSVFVSWPILVLVVLSSFSHYNIPNDIQKTINKHKVSL